jgi:capsular polysaccharide biosynthesis protein
MELDIKEYIIPLKKWWWLILVTTAVAAVASYVATRQQVPVYRSSARLIIGNSLDDPSLTQSDLNTPRQLAPIYVDLAEGPGVRLDTAEALGLQELPEYTIRQVNDTNFIEVIVTDTDPQRTQAVAQEVARQITLRSPTS